MQLAGKLLMVAFMLLATLTLVSAEDPQRESDDLLRDLVRKAVGEVFADENHSRSITTSELARDLVEIGDNEQARVVLLHDLEDLEKDYQDPEARATGLQQATSFLHEDLMYRARILARAGFGNDGRAFLERLARSATSSEVLQEDVVLSLINNQIRLGDLEGARSTRDRALKLLDQELEHKKDRKIFKEDNSEDHAQLLTQWADIFRVRLHLAAHLPAKVLDLFEQRIETTEKLSENAGSSPKALSRSVSHCQVLGMKIAEELAGAFSDEDRNPPTVEAVASLTRFRNLLKRTREIVRPGSREQEQYLIPLFAAMGDEAGAIGILENLRNRQWTERAKENDPKMEELSRWFDRRSEYWDWADQISGWTDICQARKTRQDQAAALDALKEIETLLLHPVPEPGPAPEIPGDVDNQDPAGPKRGLKDRPVAPVPTIHWEKRTEQFKGTVELMTELGEFDRAIALVKNLPPAFQFVAISPALDRLEEAGKLDTVNDLLRQNLEFQLKSLQELEARPIQEEAAPKPNIPDFDDDQLLDPFQPEPLTAQEQRSHDISTTLSLVANLQARLGKYEAAQATALQIPLEGSRIEAQANIYYYLARKGKAEEAFEQALALNRPEPRTPALLKVANACVDALNQRKKDKEGKASP